MDSFIVRHGMGVILWLCGKRIITQNQLVNRPIRIASQRSSALHFADPPRAQALWRALLLFPLRNL